MITTLIESENKSTTHFQVLFMMKNDLLPHFWRIWKFINIITEFLDGISQINQYIE